MCNMTFKLGIITSAVLDSDGSIRPIKYLLARRVSTRLGRGFSAFDSNDIEFIELKGQLLLLLEP
jgi:hypothetical protein